MNKAKKLTDQIIDFENSDKGVEDYVQLFNAVHVTTRQGSGLDWVAVRKCISTAILEVDLNNSLTED